MRRRKGNSPLPHRIKPVRRKMRGKRHLKAVVVGAVGITEGP